MCVRSIVALLRNALAALLLHEPRIRIRDAKVCIQQVICGVAARHARGRVVSVLEGGYDLPALARSVRAHLDVLLT